MRVSGVARWVIQAPKPEPRIIRYELTQYEWAAIRPFLPNMTGAGVDLVDVRPRVTTDDAEAALRLAIEGAGIIRLSDVIVGDPLRNGELVALLTDIHHVEPFPLSAIYPAGRNRLPRVAVFLKYIEERFAHAPWRLPSIPAPGPNQAVNP